MGRARVALFLLFFGSAVMVPSGFGGIVSFSSEQTSVPAGTNVVFSTMVYNNLPEWRFTSIFMVIETNAPPIDNRIQFSFTDWTKEYPDVHTVQMPMGIYPSDVMVNFGCDSGISSSSFSLGNAVVSTEGLSPGEYWIKVDEAPFNTISCGEDLTDLISSIPATFTVVPEPASLLLFLGLGALGLRTKKLYGK